MNCSFKNILDVVKTTLALILVSHVNMKNIMTKYIILNFHFFWISQHKHFVFSITRSSIDCPTPSCKKNVMCDGTCIVELFQNQSFSNQVHFIR
jgi:hypothetical protein